VRRRIPRRLATFLAAIVIGAVAVLVPASPALAASCNASGCTGKDPQAQGCSPSATTIDEFSSFGIRFELRVSYTCWAAWTRVTSPQHYNTEFAQIRSQIGQVYGVQVLQGQGWTKMINFDQFVRACRSNVWFDAPPVECTPYH
jgi:hypothetical protein